MNNKIIDTEKKSAGEYLKMLVTNFCIAFTIFCLLYTSPSPRDTR